MKLPESRALSWIGLAIRLLAAGIWLFAGAVKVADLQSFQVEVSRYQLLPQLLVAPFSYVLPFVELGVGVYLAIGLLVRGAALAGTLLFALFLAAQAWAMAKGLAIDCGCFGPAVESTVSPLTVIRDFCLGIPTFFMLPFPARFFSLDRRLFGAPNMFGEPAPAGPRD
ncbi:MAG TPA: MauE/DoxX family redox-associated membrane protein [Spirochaetia bacterium]|nr:MauE/DoxX family redox-associated membrane protein [Spirochaetia bacterium]